MKKILICLVLISLGLGALSAQELNLGSFPLGEWLDDNYDAYWVFESDNISIKQDGAVVYDFKGLVSDFKVNPGMGEITISFRCDDAGRTYEFVNKIGTTDITMMFDKDNGLDYEVVMKRQ